MELCGGIEYEDVNIVKSENNGLFVEKCVNLVSSLQRHSVCISSSCINGKRVVGLDTLASVNIFKNGSGIIDTWKCDGILISGVSNKGGSIVVNRKGICEMGLEVYVSDNCSANILSLGNVRDHCHNLEYDGEKDIFKVTVFKNGCVYLFYRNSENLYVCDLDKHVVHVKVMVETVKEKLSKYSKREIRDAIRARELQRQMGFMRGGELEKMISHGKLLECEISKRDVKRADDIWGQDIAEIKGKSTGRKGDVIKNDDSEIVTKQEKFQTAHVDLFFTNGRPFLITVFQGTEYVMVTRLQSKGIADVQAGIRRHVGEIRKQGFDIKLMYIDGESAVGSDETKTAIAELKIDLDIVAAGEAVPVVERKIRVIKERVRAAINSLPFDLSEKLEDYCVLWAVNRINLTVTSNSSTFESPREKVYGRRINVKKDCKHGFGDYVQVIENTINNSMIERSRGAIALMPTGSLDGSWWYYCLDTAKAVRRRRARALPMPQEVIDRLNELAKGRKYTTKLPKFRSNWNWGADDEYDDDSIDSEDNSSDIDRPTGEIRIQPDFSNSIYSGIGDIQDDIESEPEEITIENENDADSEISGENEDDSIDSNILEIESEIINENIDSNSEVNNSSISNTYNLRPKRATTGRWSKVALSNVISYYSLFTKN